MLLSYPKPLALVSIWSAFDALVNDYFTYFTEANIVVGFKWISPSTFTWIWSYLTMHGGLHLTWESQIVLQRSVSSFDEKLRIWDLRGDGSGSAEIVVCHSEGGGVWRHKWSPCASRLLMACMHAGFAVVRVSAASTKPSPDSPLAKPTFYRPSAKLAYGVDWHINGWAGEQRRFEALLATCSFYDNCVSFAICTNWSPTSLLVYICIFTSSTTIFIVSPKKN